MNILLTGGTGFIGQHVVQALLADGRYDVCLLVAEKYGMGTPLPPALAPLRPHIHLVYADLRKGSQTRRAVREARPHTVLHLAARGATTPFLPLETALRHNLYGSLNLMQACLDGEGATTERLLIARTPGELAAINPYSASKAAVWPLAQYYAQALGWPIIGSMIFQCYGEGQPAQTLIPAAVRSALAGENFPMTSGQQTRDFIYVGDVVAGLMAAVSAPHLPAGATLELGTGVATSLLSVVEQVYALVGRGGRPLPNTLPERAGERPQPIAHLAHTQQWLDWHPHHTLATALPHLITQIAERLTD